MTLLRNESFVPLTAAPSAGQDSEFKVAVIPAQQQARTFHSLEQMLPDSVAAAEADKKKLCEPRVSVQRDGDRVTSIRVQCTCGQVMDIACVYDPPARPA